MERALAAKLIAMQKSAYTREKILNELADAEARAQECRAVGIDDSYYEDHASFLRAECQKLDKQ